SGCVGSREETGRAAAREPLILAADATHELSFKKDGYEPEHRLVIVKVGETQVQRVELRKLSEPPAAAPPPLPVPPPAPSSSSSRHHRSSRQTQAAPVNEAPAADAEQPGYLIAGTNPLARLYIAGEDTPKITPIAPRSKIALKPG